nr:hypothetical protein [Vineibacter terrae]
MDRRAAGEGLLHHQHRQHAAVLDRRPALSSTNHRVANRGGVPRFSIPFFMTPSYDTVVRPLGSENDPAAPTFHVGKEMVATYRRIWPSAIV